MKKIKLTQGKYALVDNEDFERVNSFKWFALYWKGLFYAARSIYIKGSNETMSMHRFILNIQKGQKIIVDHRNRNGLDNQKKNLRIANHSKNRANGKKQDNTTSKYKGVHWSNSTKKWHAQIKFQGKQTGLGSFTKEEDAAIAYNKAAKEAHGEFALLNKVKAKALLNK